MKRIILIALISSVFIVNISAKTLNSNEILAVINAASKIKNTKSKSSKKKSTKKNKKTKSKRTVTKKKATKKKAKTYSGIRANSNSGIRAKYSPYVSLPYGTLPKLLPTPNLTRDILENKFNKLRSTVNTKKIKSVKRKRLKSKKKKKPKTIELLLQ